MYDPLPLWARDSFISRHALIDGHSAPFLVGGSGDPVVLIHGLSGSLDWWQYNAPELAGQFRVFMLDLPGFGRLGHLRSCDSMHEYVDWIRRWLDAVGLGQAHVIGHSMGGHLSLRLAVDDPDRVKTLVLVAPAGVLPATRLPHYLVPLMRTLRGIPPALLPLAIRDVRRANLRTVWHSSHELIEQHVLDLMEQVRVPTLIVWGDEDPIIPVALAVEFTDRIPDARLEIVEGAGHLPMVDAPEHFNRTVIEFLKAGDQAPD